MYKVIALLGLAAFGTAIPISYIQDEIDELKHEVDALKRHDLRLERRNTVLETIKADLITLGLKEGPAGVAAKKFVDDLKSEDPAVREAARQMLNEMVIKNLEKAKEEALIEALRENGFVGFD